MTLPIKILTLFHEFISTSTEIKYCSAWFFSLLFHAIGSCSQVLVSTSNFKWIVFLDSWLCKYSQGFDANMTKTHYAYDCEFWECRKVHLTHTRQICLRCLAVVHAHVAANNAEYNWNASKVKEWISVRFRVRGEKKKNTKYRHFSAQAISSDWNISKNKLKWRKKHAST